MLGDGDLLSQPNILLKTKWEPIIKKAQWKKDCDMNFGKIK